MPVATLDLSQLDVAIRSLVQPYASVTSTMDVAVAQAGQGAAHLTCIVADQQTQGRGRQGKAWMTYPGTALAATFIVRSGQGPHLPLVAAVAVADACTILAPQAHVALKWPNDILRMQSDLAPPVNITAPATTYPHQNNPLPSDNSDLGVYKIGGILVDKNKEYSMIGVGINLIQPKGITTGTPHHVLSQPGGVLTREELLNELFPCLSNALRLYASQGWPAFAERYAAKCQTIGKSVVWTRPDGQEFRGVARGLHTSGALQLRAEDGTEYLIHSGEIVAQGRV